MTSKVLLERLNGMGEYVKSASSTIETPVVRRYNEKFPTEAPKAEAPAAAKKAPATRPAPATTATAPAAPSAPAAPAAAPSAAPAPASPAPHARPEHVGARAGRSGTGDPRPGQPGPGHPGSGRRPRGSVRSGTGRPSRPQHARGASGPRRP